MCCVHEFCLQANCCLKETHLITGIFAYCFRSFPGLLLAHPKPWPWLHPNKAQTRPVKSLSFEYFTVLVRHLIWLVSSAHATFDSPRHESAEFFFWNKAKLKSAEKGKHLFQNTLIRERRTDHSLSSITEPMQRRQWGGEASPGWRTPLLLLAEPTSALLRSLCEKILNFLNQMKHLHLK